MKTIKMLVSLMLVFMMVFSMSSVALAANVTVTVDERLEDHEFVAYQIFSGTEYKATPESATQLIDVEWGDNIDEEAFLEDLKEEFGTTFDDCEDAADVAAALKNFGDNSDDAKKFADLAYDNISGTGTEITGSTATLVSGYYLIVDVTDLEGVDDANNAALLQVTGNIEIAYKTDKPSVEKKVKEDDKYTTDGGYGVGYNDVADYCINEVVTYHLIGKVPDMSEYDKYEYWFMDEMDTALRLDPDSIEVYLSDDPKVDKAEGENPSDKLLVCDSDYTVAGYTTESVTTEGFSVYFEDLKDVEGIEAGDYVIVEYQALVSLTADPGLDGYLNGVHLKYTNDPEQGGYGQTEKDYVIVFTYELDVTKVDGANTTKTLTGAEFVLYRGEGEENREYVVLDADTHKVLEWTENEDDATPLVTEANGEFKVIGLDDGTYYLKETVAPEGYNLLKKPIKLEIKATTSNVQNWDDFDPEEALTALKLDVTIEGKTPTTADGDTDKGIVATEVENNQGTTLPETGGIGTTLFYIVGAALVLGAVVVLITRKRMN